MLLEAELSDYEEEPSTNGEVPIGIITTEISRYFLL